jgi:tetratricopeptide (TPR) repeat protein
LCILSDNNVKNTELRRLKAINIIHRFFTKTRILKMTKLLKKILSFAFAVLCVQAATSQTHTDAFQAMQLKQWDKAIEIYSGLIKANPADQTALLTMGNAYLAKGDKDKAKMAFDDAFKAKPEGAMAFIANGRTLMLQNNMAEADKQFAKAAKSGKKDVNALRQIAESFLYAPPGTKPNFTRSEELLKAALDVGNKDVTTVMTLGYCYKEMPNGGLAAQQYELAESLEPKNMFIKFMLAKVYKAANLPLRYMQILDKVLELDQTNTMALREKAYYLYYARKWEEALKALEALVSKGKPITSDDEMLLANAYFVNKKYKECQELVEKIIVKDNSKTYLKRLLAYCKYETGDYARAREMMELYFKEAPKDKILFSDYVYLGRSLVKTKGDTLAAIDHLKTGITMDTTRESWTLNQEIADLYYGKKDNCSSAKHYGIYFDSIPKPTATDLYKYGVAQYFCKDDTMRYINAEKTFMRVQGIAPKATLGWLWAAKAAAKQDPDIETSPELLPQFGKAEKHYLPYIEIAAADPAKNKKELTDAYLYMGYLYWKRADNTKAKEYLQKILVYDPANTVAPEMIGAIDGVAPAAPAPSSTPAAPNGGGGSRNR